MEVKRGKSILEPSLALDHLGFTIDFSRGCLSVPPQKIKAIRKELGKLLTHQFMSCRKMAAILGALRSFLMATPFLRVFTDQMCHFVQLHQFRGWDHPLTIPASLQEEVRQLNVLTQTWKGRPFQGQVAVRHLHSDSSQVGWGWTYTQAMWSKNFGGARMDFT